jgi:hypothetical protein
MSTMRIPFAGYPTYWSPSLGSQNIRSHPLFILYSYTAIGTIDVTALKASISAIPYDGENSAILAYLLPLLSACNSVA